MKTKLIGLLLILCSCGYDAMNNRQEIIITDIESGYPGDGTSQGCYYYVKGTTKYRSSDKGYFFDECGKFTVGDTIKVVKK